MGWKFVGLEYSGCSQDDVFCIKFMQVYYCVLGVQVVKVEVYLCEIFVMFVLCYVVVGVMVCCIIGVMVWMW